MFSIYGIFYLINSFVFTICATTIALFIGNIVSNKNTISGIVNVDVYKRQGLHSR